MIIGHLTEVCKRMGLKVNEDKSKVMVLEIKEGSVCEVTVNEEIGVFEFKHLGSMLDKSGTDGVKCCRKVASRRRILSTIKSLMNTKCLQLEYAKVQHDGMLVPF